MTVSISFVPPIFDEEYDGLKMRTLVSELERLHAEVVRSFDDIDITGAEVNDLSAVVTWANVPLANIPSLPTSQITSGTFANALIAVGNVTQHEASINHDALLNFVSGEHFLQSAISIPLAQLSDVAQVSPTQFHALARNSGNTSWESRLLVEADISDLQSYLTSFTETNDLSAAVTWANVPEANIPTHTGHVTGGTSLSLVVAAITGQTALASGLAGTDELVLSDGGVIKRMDITVLEAYMEANIALPIGQVSGFTDNSTNWDTAFSWGDHAAAGYIESVFGREGDVVATLGDYAAIAEVYTAKQTMDDSTTTRAGFRLLQGVAPTSPSTGDMWLTTGDLFIRVGADNRNLSAISSLTQKGIVELATVPETNTGTDATRAVTPDGLDGWTGSAQLAIVEAWITGAAFSNWDTAYGWGNHASAGYVESVFGREGDVVATLGDYAGIAEVYTAKQTMDDSTATRAGFRLLQGVAPTAPQAGDVWVTTTDIFARIGADTRNLSAISSLTKQGIVELATVAETNTGTDASRAVTPDGLDGWTGSAQLALDAARITTGAFVDARIPNLNASKITAGVFNAARVATHTGHVTGQTSLSLAVAAITGQTALTSGLASTDELLLSDAGVIKRMDVSVIEAYMQANLSFGGGAVDSVFTRTGDVVATLGDYSGIAEVYTAKQTMDDSTTTRAGFRLLQGVAPTSPSAGDMWLTTTDLFIRVGADNRNLSAISSLTQKGIVELATVPETNAGTDATRAVTPDGLDGWTGSAQLVLAASQIGSGTLPVARGGTGVTSSTGTGNTVLSATPTFSGAPVIPILMGTAVSSRDKIRLYNTGSYYNIGFKSAFTFGGLDNDYAITFQMNDSATRGFWWGDNVHNQAQGAMALTTGGKLTVAHSIRLGYGESDVTVPGATYTLDVSGKLFASGYIRTSGVNTNPGSGKSALTQDMLFLDGKEAIDGNDAYLRLNQNGDFTSGVYTPGYLYCGGSFRVNGAIDLNGNINGDGASIIDGIETIDIDSTGDITKASHGNYLYHKSTAYDNDQNGEITFSTSAASGGTTGDIWFKYT